MTRWGDGRSNSVTNTETVGQAVEENGRLRSLREGRTQNQSSKRDLDAEETPVMTHPKRWEMARWEVGNRKMVFRR